MKIRSGFVSNSSSSSFVISKNDITYAEGQKLLNYENSSSESWSFYENDDTIGGFTIMDNNGLWEYLESINFPIDKIRTKEY